MRIIRIILLVMMMSAGPFFVFAGHANLPISVDNSQTQWFPPVADQGLSKASAAYATTYYQLSYMIAKGKDIAANNSTMSTKYSPKFIYNLGNRGIDSGISLDVAYGLLESYGAPTMDIWPSNSNYLEWPSSGMVWLNAIYGRINYVQTIKNLSIDVSSVTKLKELLAKQYILTFETYIPSWGDAINILGNIGAPENNQFVGEKAIAWMNPSSIFITTDAATIVGYNDNLWIDVNNNGNIDAGEKGAFKVVNSKGTAYGNQGFIWIAYDALRKVSKVPAGPLWPLSSGRLPIFDKAYLLLPKNNGSYEPKIVGRIKIISSNRNSFTLGYDVTNPNQPVILSNVKYFYPFSGGNNPVNAVLFLDFTEKVPATPVLKDYHMVIRAPYLGNPVTINNFVLMDTTDGYWNTTTYAKVVDINSNNSSSALLTTYPVVINNSWFEGMFSYTAPFNNYNPIVNAFAESNPGSAPVNVNIYGVGSHDSDGAITDYRWDFGKVFAGSINWTDFININTGINWTNQPLVTGINWSSPLIPVNGINWNDIHALTRTYTTSGAYVAKLTVTDNNTATATSENVFINVSNVGIGTTQ